MSTLFARVWAYHKTNKKPLLSNLQRQQLGIIVKEEFKKTGLRYGHKDVKEPDYEGTVIFYPKSFTPKLDELIEKHDRKHKTRKRIPIKRN